MDDEKKKGFSLRKSPSTLRVFGIELIIVFLVGIIIFAGLLYFKVITFDSLLNGQVIVDGKKYDLSSSSKTGGYVLKVKDKKGLIRLLSEWGVYGKTYNGGYGLIGGTGSTPVTKIKVYFVDQIQPINQFVTKEGEVYMSSITNASGNELSVHIHLGKFILDDTEYNTKLWRQFDYIFLTTIYNLANRESRLGQNNEPNSPLQIFLKEKNEKNIQLFELSKI